MASVRDDPLRPLRSSSTRSVAPQSGGAGAGRSRRRARERGRYSAHGDRAGDVVGSEAPLRGLAAAGRGLRAAARTAAALKSAGFPILASRPDLDLLTRDPDLRDDTRRAPRARLTDDVDRRLRNCTRLDRPLADVRELHATGEHLSRVFDLPGDQWMLERSATRTKWNNPDVIELSWPWDLRPAMLRKVAELTSL